ncbi:hypothetical protein ND436_002800 [Neisseria gonorrhoeae]|nr:hypothetical protein [Neisseria gonorrhoeae]UYP52470.1 hypothetical protein ND436_002800 [Neisseria gonorrhoeae]
MGREIKARKLAHREMQRETLAHQEWDLAREAEYWRAKLAAVDANGKTGVKIREKILTLEDQLSKQSTEAKMNQASRMGEIGQAQAGDGERRGRPSPGRRTYFATRTPGLGNRV